MANAKVEPDAGCVALLRDFMRMPEHGRKTVLHLGRLYLVRKMAPSPEVQAEIDKIDRAIRDGRPWEIVVPSAH